MKGAENADRAEAVGFYLLLGMFAGIYLLVAAWFALLAIGLSSFFPVDPLVLVVTVLTGVGLYAKRPPQAQDGDTGALRRLVGLLISVGWAVFVVMTGRMLGLTVAFAVVTGLAFTLVLVVFSVIAGRTLLQEERRNAEVAAANRANIVQHWAQEAERLPELRDMLRQSGWQPDAPGAREGYLKVWDEYKARRRARGLPAWPRAEDAKRDRTSTERLSTAPVEISGVTPSAEHGPETVLRR